jgi:hypothetical protein
MGVESVQSGAGGKDNSAKNMYRSVNITLVNELILLVCDFPVRYIEMAGDINAPTPDYVASTPATA